MNRQTLNLQSDKIESVFAAHKSPARVWGGRLTLWTTQFHLAPAATTQLARLESLTDEVALAIGVVSARLTRANGMLALEIPRADVRLDTLAELQQQLQTDDAARRAFASAGTAILGRDAQGAPLLFRLFAPEVAPVLIAGATGSGKTELARTILASLIQHQKPRDLQIALFDPKQHGLAPFAMLPHLMFPLVADAPEMIARMHALTVEMGRREREHIARPRVVVVIDALEDALQIGGRAIADALRELAQRGTSAGIAVIACAREPRAEIGALFSTRIVGRMQNPASNVRADEWPELFESGRFLLFTAGQTILFRAAQTDLENQDADAVRARTTRGHTLLRLVK